MTELDLENIDATPTGTQRELREYARGELDVDHSDVHPIAGLIQDDEIRNTLIFMAENYDRTDENGEPIDGLPRSFWDTSFARRAIRKFTTETASKAIRNDNVSQMSYITGLPSYQSDISGLHAINQLADWLVHSEQCKLIYMAALMGKGKTDFACTLLEVVADHYDRVDRSTDESVPTPEFAANFEVDAGDDATVEVFDTYDELLEWGEKGSSDDERWFVFDEASTELTAQSGKNAQTVAEVMAPFVKKMRKMGINMIVIGHDKGDIHVAIRSLADFVDKRGLKTAKFYAGINDREPTGHLFDVSGIPETSWDFDTDDTATWSWGSAVEDDEPQFDGLTKEEAREERNERMARLYELTEITQTDLAEAFDVSTSTVSNVVNSFEFMDSQNTAVAD